MKQLRHKGQYYIKPFAKSEFGGVKLMTATIFAGLVCWYIGLPAQVPISPAGHALAAEPTPTVKTYKMTYAEKKADLVESLYGTYKTDKSVIEKIVTAWGLSEGKAAVKVAMCESSHNPNASHPDSSARGLFQILQGTWNLYKCDGSPVNADDNIKCAYKIYQNSGWGSSGSWLASKPCHGYN